MQLHKRQEPRHDAGMDPIYRVPGFHLQGSSTWFSFTRCQYLVLNWIWYIMSLPLVDLLTGWIICQHKRRSCPVTVSYLAQPAVVLQTTVYSVLGVSLAMPMSTVNPANLHGQYTVAPDSTDQCPHQHHGTVHVIRMKCPPGSTIQPSLQTMHFLSWTYSLSTSQLLF